MTDSSPPVPLPMEVSHSQLLPKPSKTTTRPPEKLDDELPVVPKKKVKIGLPHSTPNLPHHDVSVRRHQLSIKLQFRKKLTMSADHTPKENPMHACLRAWMLEMVNKFGSTVIFSDGNGIEFDLHSLAITDDAIKENFCYVYKPQGYHVVQLLLHLDTPHSMCFLKKPVLPWLQENGVSMNIHRFDHDLDTIRIGVLKGIHPGLTYRLALQEKINFQIQDIITAMTIAEREALYKKHIEGYQGGYRSLPTIRLDKGNISAFSDGQNVHERALVVEVLKAEQTLIMELAPKLFPTTSTHPLLLYDMPKNKNIPQAASKYYEQVKQHQYKVKNTIYDAIHGVDETMMTSTNRQEISFLADLLQHDSVKSVEKTTGTPRIGRWLILTSFEHRQEVVAHIQRCLTTHFATVKIQPRFKVFPGVNETAKYTNPNTTYAQALVRDMAPAGTPPQSSPAPHTPDKAKSPSPPLPQQTSHVVTPPNPSTQDYLTSSSAGHDDISLTNDINPVQIRQEERKAMRTEFKDMFDNLTQALDDFVEEQVEENRKTRNRYSKHVQILQDQLGKYHQRQEDRITELSVKQDQQATEIKNVDDRVKALEEELDHLKRAFEIEKKANKWWQQNYGYDTDHLHPSSQVEALEHPQETVHFSTQEDMDTATTPTSDTENTPQPSNPPSSRFTKWRNKLGSSWKKAPKAKREFSWDSTESESTPTTLTPISHDTPSRLNLARYQSHSSEGAKKLCDRSYIRKPSRYGH